MSTDQPARRVWSIEEIEAWGRNDIPALAGAAAPEPTPDPAGPKSDASWHDEWRRDVAAKQKAAFEAMKHG